MAIDAKRQEGFTGQHLVVLPDSIVRGARNDPLLRGVLPTAAGYFPEASGHFVERLRGSADTIMILCSAGRGWFRLGADGAETQVRAGDAVCIPAKMPHSYGADARQAWTISWVHCTGVELASFLRILNLDARTPTLSVPAEGIDALGFAHVYQILETGYSHANLILAAAHLRAALAELYRLRVSPGVHRRSTNEKIDLTIEIMRAHYDRSVRLSQLAETAGLSVPHYSTLFRRKTGFSPIDYFLRLKIQRACQLLDTTGMKIEEVAARVGYDDPYYFSRLFRKVMNCSPRAYRSIQKG